MSLRTGEREKKLHTYRQKRERPPKKPGGFWKPSNREFPGQYPVGGRIKRVRKREGRLEKGHTLASDITRGGEDYINTIPRDDEFFFSARQESEKVLTALKRTHPLSFIEERGGEKSQIALGGGTRPMP